MRITVISVSNQPPELLVALRPSEIDDLVLSLQALKLNPSTSLGLSAASSDESSIASVEIFLDETGRGPSLKVSPTKRRKTIALGKGAAA